MHVRHVWLASLAFAASLLCALEAKAQESVPEWPPAPPPINVRQLPGGVRVVYLPDVLPGPTADRGLPDAVEIAFGYAPRSQDSGAFPEPAHEVAVDWLLESVPARTAGLVAYLTGGEFRTVDEPELVGLRLRVPGIAAGAVLEQAAAFLNLELSEGELLDHVLLRRTVNPGPVSDLMDQAARAVVSALLDGTAPAGPAPPAPAPDPGLVREYFRDRFGTDRAWVIVSWPPTPEDLVPLGSIRERPSESAVSVAAQREAPGTADLVFASQPEGGVVSGSRVSGVHYEAWFNALIVHHALRRALDSSVRLEFGPSREETAYLVKAPVRFPAYPEDTRAALLGAMEALQSGPPAGVTLHALKQETLEWLGSRPVLEWFAAQDLWRPLEEGWARIWHLTEDEFRSSAGAFLGAPRVTAAWSPALDEPALTVEGLGTEFPDPPAPPPALEAPGRIEIPSLGALPRVARDPVRVEGLPTGVTLAEGPPAVFISGPFAGNLPGGEFRSGPNGTLWTFEELPGPEVLEAALGRVRPDRLLVFAPAAGIDRARETFSDWRSGATDATDSAGIGQVATVDLPALVILKTWLDRRVIEAGWAGTVVIRIAGTEGSRLSVEADTAREAEVLSWLDAAAATFAGEDAEEEFLGLRAAAGAWFDRLRTELQILLWQRAPDGQVLPPDTVSLAAFRNLLNIYY